MKRIPIYLAIAVLLAFVSFMTTGIQWDGWCIGVEIHIRIVDEEGTPVESVRLIPEGPLRPLVENDLTSNANGEMAVHGLPLGYGGFQWKLFWLIPMGDMKAPNTSYVFQHPDFHSLQINYMDFHRGDEWDDSKTVDFEYSGGSYELLRISRKVVLKKHEPQS